MRKVKLRIVKQPLRPHRHAESFDSHVSSMLKECIVYSNLVTNKVSQFIKLACIASSTLLGRTHQLLLELGVLLSLAIGQLVTAFLLANCLKERGILFLRGQLLLIYFFLKVL